MDQLVEIPPEEIVVLSKRLKAVPSYYVPRLEPEQLAAVIRKRHAVIMWQEDRIEAFAALWPTNLPNCFELGTVWVGEGLRGQGLRGVLMAEAIALARKDADLFLFTSVGKIMESAALLGFEPITTSKERVLLWASDVGVVTRLPRSIHPIVGPDVWGKPKEKERWLFWKRRQIVGKGAHD